MDEKIKALTEALCGSKAWDGFREESYYPFTLSDGTTGYFELILYEKDDWMLLAYVGDEAVQAQLRFRAMGMRNDLESIEAANFLDYYMLSALDDEVTLSRSEPRWDYRDATESEKAIMAEILSVALTAPKAAKLPKMKKHRYPAFESGDEAILDKIKAAPSNGEKWIAHIFLHFDTAIPEDGGEAFYPYVFFLIEEKSGRILRSAISSRFEDYGEFFLSVLSEAVEECGKPRTILTVNERSRDFFKPFCQQMGMEFEKRSSSPKLQAALDVYESFFAEKDEEEDEEYIPDYEDEEIEDEEGWDEVNSVLLELAANPETLPRLSTELLSGLLADMENGDMDDALKGVIAQELKRREK